MKKDKYVPDNSILVKDSNIFVSIIQHQGDVRNSKKLPKECIDAINELMSNLSSGDINLATKEYSKLAAYYGETEASKKASSLDIILKT